MPCIQGYQSAGAGPYSHHSPKKKIPQLNDAAAADQALLGQLMLVAQKVADREGVADAFRLVLNNGAGAGQEIFHLHFHLLAGRSFTWPPG